MRPWPRMHFTINNNGSLTKEFYYIANKIYCSLKCFYCYLLMTKMTYQWSSRYWPTEVCCCSQRRIPSSSQLLLTCLYRLHTRTGILGWFLWMIRWWLWSAANGNPKLGISAKYNFNKDEQKSETSAGWEDPGPEFGFLVKNEKFLPQ